MIAGIAEPATADSSCASRFPAKKLQFQAVIWGLDLHRVRALPLPGTDTVSVALWMNDKGQAVGASGNCSNANPPPITAGPHAILWEGTGRRLTSGTSAPRRSTQVSQSTTAGKWSGLPLRDDSTQFNGTHVFLWTRQHGMKDLCTLSGDVAIGALSVNDAGEIVGISIDQPVIFEPFTGMTASASISTLRGRPDPICICCGLADINNRGEITGWGVDTSTGEIHTYLAVPNRMRDGTISRPGPPMI